MSEYLRGGGFFLRLKWASLCLSIRTVSYHHHFADVDDVASSWLSTHQQRVTPDWPASRQTSDHGADQGMTHWRTGATHRSYPAHRLGTHVLKHNSKHVYNGHLQHYTVQRWRSEDQNSFRNEGKSTLSTTKATKCLYRTKIGIIFIIIVVQQLNGCINNRGPTFKRS